MENLETAEEVDYSQALSKNAADQHTSNQPGELEDSTSCADVATTDINKRRDLINKSNCVRDDNAERNNSFVQVQTEFQGCNDSETNMAQEGTENSLRVGELCTDKKISQLLPHSNSENHNSTGGPSVTNDSVCHLAQELPHTSEGEQQLPLSGKLGSIDKEESELDNPHGQSRPVPALDVEYKRDSTAVTGEDYTQSIKSPPGRQGDVGDSATTEEQQIAKSESVERDNASSAHQLSEDHNISRSIDHPQMNPFVKLELMTNDAGKEEVGRGQEEDYSENNGDAEKQKEAVLRLLNIPAETSANITDEELKILTKYVFLNPGVSEMMSASSKNIPDVGTNRKRNETRKHAPRRAKSTPTAARGRGRPARFANKRALRQPARQVSESEDEEEDEESGEEQTERYTRLPLEEKLKVLKLKKDGLTNVKIAKKLGLTNSRVWRILQKKKELLAEAKQGKKKKNHRRTKKEMENDKKKAAKNRNKRKKDVDGVESQLEMKVEEELNDKDDGDISIDETERNSKGSKARKDLTLADRKKVIETLEASKTKIKDLAKRFGVSTSSISRIKKNKEVMKLKLANGDLCGSLRRWRDCKDPELDKVLTKWYRAFEEKHSLGENGGAVSVTNALLREKAHDLALIMGSHYFASDNWIHRWKNRHNIRSRLNLVSDRETFQLMDSEIDISVILDALGKQQYKMDEAKREALRQSKTKPEEFLICEHCGVLISSKRKRLDHLAGCPGALSRKDLTLREKANIVRHLEEQGVTMVSLARKYGVSTSAISRIHKSRVEILARVAEGGKSLAKRKRDRPSKEPEVERLLCDWYREQRDMGVHATGSAIRDKARDIARVLGKDFWPSESWVFRWRHRHNMTGNPAELNNDDDEEEDEEEEAEEMEKVLDPATGELCTSAVTQANELASSSINKALIDPSATAGDSQGSSAKRKRPRLPKLIMCEKCGCVSPRKKNSRPVRIRHAKGCPDIRQRNEMTYEDRAKMVHALEEPGATLSSVARQFGVSVSSMSRIRQRKNEILSFTGSKGESKRIRSCKEPEIAEMLYQYYTEKKAVGIHINGPKLKERASMLAREMGREFKVSSGWLGRWRHRYNVFTTPKTPSEKLQERQVSQATSSKSRRKQKKSSKASEGVDGQIIKSAAVAAQITISEYDADGASLGSQVINDNSVEPIPATATSLQPPVFLHRSFQTSWDLITHQQQQQQLQQHQQAAVGSWVKDIMPTAIATTLADQESVTYTYSETPAGVLPKPLFHHHTVPSHHNMFEQFQSAAAAGYHMALPPGIDASSANLMGRDFLKEDGGDDSASSAVKTHTGHLPHPLLPSHSQAQHPSLPNAQQSPTSSSSQHHHHPPHHPHHQYHTRQHLHHLQNHHHHHQALQLQGNPGVESVSSTPTSEEEVDHQRHLMDALKMMSNFATSKSLGDHVQSALRTIEMSMKSNSRKFNSTRGRFPNMQ